MPEAKVVNIIDMAMGEQAEVERQALAEPRVELMNEHRETPSDYERRIGGRKNPMDEWDKAWWELNTELEELRA